MRSLSAGRHEAFFRSLKAQTLNIPADPTDDLSEPLEVAFAAGELVNIEWSYKYSQAEVLTLFESANLRPITRFNDPGSSYNLWVLQRPPFQFPSLTKALAAPVAADEASLAGQMGQHERANTLGVPRRDEWEDLWHLWDTVTLGMIKAEKLHEKPIDLRHKSASPALAASATSLAAALTCSPSLLCRSVLPRPHPDLLRHLPLALPQGAAHRSRVL